MPDPVAVPDDIEARLREVHATAWLCRQGVTVRDANASGTQTCKTALTLSADHAIVGATGIPHHDFASGPGCCATNQGYTWRLPISPRLAEVPTDAPLRGPIGVAVNGVALFGPEDGPGGDAVASHHGAYEEDRQHIWLGTCHGHAGPGGQYHYHADAGCVHWHEPGAYSWDALDGSAAGIVGFAFDGFPIYGMHGWDADGQVVEITSGYLLRDGATGYGGISDYEFTDSIGDLDECNGHVARTPDFPDGVYHYHATRHNGDGELGFPYFPLCYVGVVEQANHAYGSTDNVAAGPAGPPCPPPGRPPPPQGCP